MTNIFQDALHVPGLKIKLHPDRNADSILHSPALTESLLSAGLRAQCSETTGWMALVHPRLLHRPVQEVRCSCKVAYAFKRGTTTQKSVRKAERSRGYFEFSEIRKCFLEEKMLES